MTNSTTPAVGSSELAKANGNNPTGNKPTADEHPVVKDETVKGKPALDRVKFVRDAHNRVILYAFSDQRKWVDKGTGHVACVQSRDQPDAWWIVVRLEYSEKNVLEARILPDIIYQEQPGAVIIWSEPDVGKLKLSLYEFAGCTEILEKICQIQAEGKLRNSLEVQLRQTLESNRQLTAEIHTSKAKNQETLDINRNLEQELSNAQAKIRDLEAKCDQIDVGLMIAVLKENVGKLENGEISRLQKKNEKLSNENSEILKKLEESEKRNDVMYEENEEMQEKKMAEESKSWEHLRQLLGGATEYVDGIRKRKAEQRLALPLARMLEDPEELEIRTELASDGTLAKRARIDTQKNLAEVGAKNAANMASGS